MQHATEAENNDNDKKNGWRCKRWKIKTAIETVKRINRWELLMEMLLDIIRTNWEREREERRARVNQSCDSNPISIDCQESLYMPLSSHSCQRFSANRTNAISVIWNCILGFILGCPKFLDFFFLDDFTTNKTGLSSSLLFRDLHNE